VARLGLGPLRDANLEHAVGQRGLDLLAVHGLRKNERARERTELTLEDAIAVLVLLLLELALAAQREDVLLDVDFHVLGLEAGDLRGEDQRVLLLVDVDARR